MTDLNNLSEGVRLGIEADTILNSEVFDIAKVACSGEILSQLYNVDVSGDSEKALELVRSLQNMNRLIQQFEAMVEDGNFCQAQLKSN